MQTFRINRKIEVVCEALRTRNGFKHTATLLIDGNEADSVKICYLNRTWERYEYESVLEKLANEATSLLDSEKKLFLKKIKNRFGKEDRGVANLKTISTVMALGSIFGKTQTEQNDWKARMLKAGLENRGLIMPEDWDELDESTKQNRLDKVIATLGV